MPAGEFLAIVDGLRYLKERRQPDLPIYSDSYNARKWVSNKECRTNLAPTPVNVPIFHMIEEALCWLRGNPITTPILTRDTEEWGEILRTSAVSKRVSARRQFTERDTTLSV